MKVEALSIPDVLLLTPVVHADARGTFLESWNAREFAMLGLAGPFVQDNESHSVRCVLRGLHCQVQHTQGKLIRAVLGEVFDVAVDLRSSSPTFGTWCAARLTGEGHAMMWIPPGFAHGYYTLTARATVLYKVTDYYSPSDEKCVKWNDPAIGIAWPVAEAGEPILSERDQDGVLLAEAKGWFE